MENIGLVLNTVEANTLTDDLLKQSQSQAVTLRLQQDELRESNEDLGRQTKLLEEQNIEAEQKKREVEAAKRLIEEKVGQLAVSSRYKSEFIANMSHELRTPLNSLLILAEQLEDNPEESMTETQVKYASTIRASGQDLLKLLNSILDLAKIESGTTTVEMEDISTEQLRIELLRDFELVARGKGLDYSFDISPDAPSRVQTDPQRLSQILRNLIANAFKFTETGGVFIGVAPAEDGWSSESTDLVNAPSVLAFSVRDTGIGIEREQQLRIFEAFAQGDGSTARLYGGTGLGLSISRALVALLGGEIVLASVPGQGCTFTVYLPQGHSAEKEAARTLDGGSMDMRPSVLTHSPNGTAPTTVDPGERVHGPSALDDHPFAHTSVLVVDDDFRNVFALSALLERGDATITAAESGQEAIDLLEQTPDIDIVLMDIMMPGMDGYETIRTIRMLERFKTLPIIAVTGKVVAGERQRCLDAGADDYVPKPVNTDELVAAIGPWLQVSSGSL
jgi:signal transduction histidine kinase